MYIYLYVYIFIPAMCSCNLIRLNKLFVWVYRKMHAFVGSHLLLKVIIRGSGGS